MWDLVRNPEDWFSQNEAHFRNASAFSGISIFKSHNLQNVQSNNIRFESNLSIILNIDELIK